MATSNKQQDASKKASAKPTNDGKKITTDFPLSEKDEVKNAEKRTQKKLKKI